jgi:hypothetical protein
MRNDSIETFEKNGYKVTIERDFDAERPFEGDEECFIVTTRNRYFEVEGPNGEYASDIGENLSEWEEEYDVFPLQALIHGGVHLSLASLDHYYMGFDSGQIGFVVVKRDETPDTRKYAEGMVETWNQYLSGDVYGFIIEDGEGTDVDSCWGFYGLETVKQEAISAVPENPPLTPYTEEEEEDD